MSIDLSLMDTGDLLAIEGRGLWNAFIRWRTKSPWTHVAMILHTCEGVMVVQATPSLGVAPILLERFLMTVQGIVWIGYLNRALAAKTNLHYRDDLTSFMVEHYADRYDWGGIWHYVLPWFKEHKGEEYCSELCARAYTAAGFFMASLLSPGQVFSQPIISQRVKLREDIHV